MEDALQLTQLITNIIIILLFLGVLFLVSGLIKQMKKITSKVEVVSKDFSEIKPRILEFLERSNLLTGNINAVVKKVNEHVDVLGTVVDKVKDTADSVIEFEKKIQNAVEPPVMETLNTVTAVSAGVKTFFESWKNNKSKKENDNEQDEKIDEINENLEEVSKELDEINSRLADTQK